MFFYLLPAKTFMKMMRQAVMPVLQAFEDVKIEKRRTKAKINFNFFSLLSTVVINSG